MTEAEKFIEGMGVSAQADGLPRIAGRLIGLMILNDGPFSFSELATRLGVSRASISTNSRLLENLGIIERVGQTGDRQTYFQLSHNPYAKMLQGMVFRMSKVSQLVETAQKNLPKGRHQDRLGELNDFYQQTITAYLRIIKHMEGK